MAVDNIARALAAKALESSAGSVTPEDLEKKYDKTGGAISGDVSIQGDLTVSGTTTTEKEKQLLVEENVIATNANKVDLKTLLSGLAINKNASATYGIMYDPADDSVKLGLGTLDAEKKFTFNDSGTDGKAIATRADSSALTDGDLVKWDGTTNSLVDSGKKTDDFVEKVTVTEGSNLAYVAKNDGTQGTLPVATGAYSNTLAQRTTNGRLLVGTAVEDSDAMPKKQVEDGFVAKISTEGAERCYTITPQGNQSARGVAVVADEYTVPLRTAGGVVRVGTPVGVNDATAKEYVDKGFVAKQTTTTPNESYLYAYDKNGDRQFRITGSAIGNSVPFRDDRGRLRVGTAVGDSDAMPKKQVDDGFVAKQIPETTRSAYTTNTDGNQSIMPIHGGSAEPFSIAARSSGGVVRVGTPVGVNDATTKAYVDGLHHYTHIISLVGSSNTIYITIAAKNYPNPITSIDNAGSTPSLSDLLLASGQSAKAMATGLVTDIDGSAGTVVALWSDEGSVMVDFIVNGTSSTSISNNSVTALESSYTITDIVA